MTVLMRSALITLLLSTVLGLTGCGVRGALDVPEGETAVRTDQLPPENPKHRPFILDGLVK